MDRLLGEPDERARGWRGREGDAIVGELVSYRRATASSDRGGDKPCWVMRIRVEETAGSKSAAFEPGELAEVWLLHSVLKDEVWAQRPRPGERVGIRRLQDGEGYRRYRLDIDRGEDGPQVPDWESQDDEEETPAAVQDGLPFD